MATSVNASSAAPADASNVNSNSKDLLPTPNDPTSAPSNSSTPKLPSSREPSPKRAATNPSTNSSRNPSPARSSAAVKANSAASLQRQRQLNQLDGSSNSILNEQTIPTAHASSEQPISPRPQRPFAAKSSSLSSASSIPPLHWPTSPRLASTKSPPPSRSPGVLSPRKQLESGTPLPPPLSTSDLGRYQSLQPVNEPTTNGVTNGGTDSGEPSSGGEAASGDGDDMPSRMPARTTSSPGPSTGVSFLETVRESSLPSTPAIGSSRRIGETNNNVSTSPYSAALAAATSMKPPVRSLTSLREDLNSSPIPNGPQITIRTTTPTPVSITPKPDPEVEAGYRSEEQRPKPPMRPSSRTTLIKPEIETVVSVPQSDANNSRGEKDPQGDHLGTGHSGRPTASLRSKKSNDTIKPKKEKKDRRPPSTAKKAPINPNAPASKVDTFAAKIADAVDALEAANSSDSEETFVYESNPPEPHPHTGTSQRPKYHSRTPSVTSLQSADLARHPQADIHRGRGGLIHGSGTHSDASGSKRSMKFTSNPHGKNANKNGDGPGADMEIDGSATPGTVVRHPGNGNRSLFSDRGGPFSKQHLHSPTAHNNRKPSQQSVRGPNQKHGSRPGSPRHHNQLKSHGNSGSDTGGRSSATKVSSGSRWTSYEGDVEMDGEQAPLMGRRNGNRKRGQKNIYGTSPDHDGHHGSEERSGTSRGWFCRKLVPAICIIALLLVIVGMGGSFFMLTKSLKDVKILVIKSPIVTQQEIVADIVVSAVNPNFLPMSVIAVAIDVFAKSPWVGKDSDWSGDKDRDVPLIPIPSPGRGWRTRALSKRSDVDDGTDTDPDPSLEGQTMLLGRISTLDSALNFDPSPFKWHPSNATSLFTLSHPGNETEAGGSKRWERVSEHSFELRLRGVLKYQVPLGGFGRGLRTAQVEASVIVDPSTGADPKSLRVGGESKLVQAGQDNEELKHRKLFRIRGASL